MITILFTFILATIVTDFTAFQPENRIYNQPKFEYIQLSMSIGGLHSKGRRVRVLSEPGKDFFGSNLLKDEHGNIMRFPSIANLIEYMEWEKGYEYLNTFTTGESNTTVHLLMRRPYENPKIDTSQY